jgi:hypothetical protein
MCKKAVNTPVYWLRALYVRLTELHRSLPAQREMKATSMWSTHGVGNQNSDDSRALLAGHVVGIVDNANRRAAGERTRGDPWVSPHQAQDASTHVVAVLRSEDVGLLSSRCHCTTMLECRHGPAGSARAWRGSRTRGTRAYPIRWMICSVSSRV